MFNQNIEERMGFALTCNSSISFVIKEKKSFDNLKRIMLLKEEDRFNQYSQ